MVSNEAEWRKMICVANPRNFDDGFILIDGVPVFYLNLGNVIGISYVNILSSVEVIY